MDKGIKKAVDAKFDEMLAVRAEIGDKAFRKGIIMWTVEQFGVSINSAATAYNNSFKACKLAAPQRVVGLGRPEGKNNGGRKKKVVVAAVDDSVTAEMLAAGLAE